jgi:hypothetical protein
VASQILDEDFVLAVLLEEIPQDAWLLPVNILDVGRIGLYPANPFAVGDVGWAAPDLSE